MPITVPMQEPKSADYIYIDAENNVHLLLPIVGGDTIAIDNTCKTVMEMQTFFYGRESHGSVRSQPSALAVLESYAIALQTDISALETYSEAFELLDKKRHRLLQIQGYLAILRLVNDLFVSQTAPYPTFPAGVQTLLQKQTNCLSMCLSPRVPDHFLQTQTPVFSVARLQPSRNFFSDAPRPDTFEGLCPNLRRHLLLYLQQPGTVITPKAQTRLTLAKDLDFSKNLKHSTAKLIIILPCDW